MFTRVGANEGSSKFPIPVIQILTSTVVVSTHYAVHTFIFRKNLEINSLMNWYKTYKFSHNHTCIID